MICNVIACYSYQLSTNEKDVFWVLVSFVDLFSLDTQNPYLNRSWRPVHAVVERKRVCVWNCTIATASNSCKQTCVACDVVLCVYSSVIRG